MRIDRQPRSHRLAKCGAGAQRHRCIQDGQLLPLWSGPAPGALGAEAGDIPAITVFLPRTMTANTPAMIVCPGGGYVNLAMNHEGRQVASYLNSLGIAAFVLRSRLGPRYHHPTELGDAQRAIRMLRAHAAEWRLDPARIGIVGFSAGGHLAMTASTHFAAGNADAADVVDRANSRPDLACGFRYIDDRAWTHRDRRTVLGATPTCTRRSLSASSPLRKRRHRPFCSHQQLTRPCRRETLHSYMDYAERRAAEYISSNEATGVGLANDDAACPSGQVLDNWLRVPESGPTANAPQLFSDDTERQRWKRRERSR